MNNKNDIVFSTIGGGKFSPSPEFIELFPEMNRLLQSSVVIDFTIDNNQKFRQYIWIKSDKSTVGWLCRLEHCIPQGRNIIDEHALLSCQVGGIIDYWVNKSYEIDTDTFIDNNNFTFSLVNSGTGIGGWEKLYLSACENEELVPLDTSDFVTFALEANGNTTFYNKNTKEVFYYAHDGYFPIDIFSINGQPEYTIHKFDGIETFTDYVETLAVQWQKIIK